MDLRPPRGVADDEDRWQWWGNPVANASDVDGNPLTVSAFSVAGEAGPFVVGAPYPIAGVGTLS